MELVKSLIKIVTNITMNENMILEMVKVFFTSTMDHLKIMVFLQKIKKFGKMVL